MENNQERTRAEQLADEHWAYILDLLKMHGQEELALQIGDDPWLQAWPGR